MSELSAKERAKIIRNMAGNVVHNFEKIVEAHITQAEQAAKAEERERCCKAMCFKCKDGVPLSPGGEYHPPVNEFNEYSDFPCQAAAIRRGGGDDT